MTAPLTSQAIRACPALRKIILQQAANAAASLSFPALKSEACRFEGQFGTDQDKAHNKKTIQNFRVQVLRELKKIKIAWPELNYTTAKGVLILSPSKPAIAPTTGPQRLVE